MGLRDRLIKNSKLIRDIYSSELSKSCPIPYNKPESNSKYKLMIKSHMETGVHYLCVTTKKDYIKYLGSGVLWKRLILKIPSFISTRIIFESDDLSVFNQMCYHFSEYYDVVNNKNFANIIPEYGCDKYNSNLIYYTKNNKDILSQIQKNNRKRYLETHGYDDKYMMVAAREAMKAKYGNPMYDENIRRIVTTKSKETMRRKYGCEYGFHVDIKKNLEKRSATNMERFGGNSLLESPLYKDDQIKKMHEGVVSKYGVENISQSPLFKEKIKKGMQNFYLNEDNKKFKCKHCDYTNYKFAVTKHEYRCRYNPDRLDDVNKKANCEFCQKEYTVLGVHQHKILCHMNPNRKILDKVNCEFCGKAISKRGYLNHKNMHIKKENNNK